MPDRRVRIAYVLVVLLASRIGWAAYEFVGRNYGPGVVTGSLLDATPQAAAAAGIAWLVTTLVLTVVGVLLVRLFRGGAV